MPALPSAMPPQIAIAADSSASAELDRAEVSALDLAYQSAVKRNDAAAMDKILHPQFALILGGGAVISRDELLDSARKREIEYDLQDEDPGTQAVRVWGDTAVVTARLRIKGRKDGKPLDRLLWFSDTYVRTKSGWRYAFAQASLPLPEVK
jgi:ketosteroid isomerase-like protein